MKYRNRSLLIIFITAFVDLVGFGIIIPLSPYLATEYGADAIQVGLLMTIYSLMQFLFSPFWGQLSDIFGRRPIILMSLAGSGVTHLVFALAPNFVWLLVARTLAGIFAANISASMAYVADVTETGDRSKSMGIIGAAIGLGFIFGPFIGGVFSNVGLSLGTSPPFGGSFPAVIASLICLSNLVFAFFYLNESLPSQKRAHREVSFLKGHRDRIQRLKKFVAHRTLGPLLMVYFLFSFAMAHMEASLFLFVLDEFDWSSKTASYGFAYVGMIIVFTQGYLIRKLLPRLGERSLLVAGLLLMIFGFWGVSGSQNGSLALLAASVTLFGLGHGLSSPSAHGSISLLSSASEQGAVMGVSQSLGALGRIVGPVTGGWLYRDISHGSPFVAAGLTVLLSLLIVLNIYSILPNEGQSRSGRSHAK